MIATKHLLIVTALAAAAGVTAGTALAAETLSLEGTWRVRRDDRRQGFDEKWYVGPLASDAEGCGTMHLPGTLDEAGLAPKNTAPATLAGPYRIYDYAGPVWYQREIEIPAAWQGRHLTLLLERVRWVTHVWLDDKLLGTQDSLIAPHVYQLGAAVAPGKHRLTICVDNTVKIQLGRFVSALFGGTPGNFNGIVGRLELAATPPVWVDNVQVYPDVDRKTAAVKVRIGNATGKPGRGTLRAGAKSVEAVWDESGGRAEIEVDMSGAKLWDEFSPHLSELTVSLGADRRTVRFGMRKFAVRGTQFTLNDRPIYLRGTLECAVFPLTGYPPTDVPAWQRIYRIVKTYGLNHIRFHSWCPPEAAFAAADSEGIIVHAEGPQANVSAGADPARDAFIEAELKRIVDTYGNHPSFCLMTLGNEYGGTDELLTRWVDMLIQRDARRLYSSASCAQKTANRQWTVEARGRGVHDAGTDHDLREVVAREPRPIVGHEIGQWTFFPDFNEMKKYTGVLAPKNFELVRNDLEKKHLLDLTPSYVRASGNFAVSLYKEEIEVLLRTPGYAGFSLLDLHDYPTQGTALVGPLDPFWDAKGFIAPQAFRRFCGPTVPLARIKNRVYAADEPLEATAEVAHFGPADLTAVEPAWTLADQQGREVARGKLPALRVPTGKLTALGALRASLAKAPAPCKLTLTVALGGTPFSNDWEIWVYPSGPAISPPADVAVCDSWEAAQAALADGKKAVYFAASVRSARSMSGRFLPVFWSPVWFPQQKPNTMGILCDPRHALFASFPTESHSNWQWYDLLNRSRLFILDDTPPDYRPLVQVIDNFARNHKLGVVFEAKVGSGRLLVCGLDLPGMARKDPAARQLLASLYNYVGSEAFNPARELGSEAAEKLFPSTVSSSTLRKLGAKVLRADSEDAANGNLASNAIDGDSETFWHTRWQPKNDHMPHELVIDLGREMAIKGISYLPRQDKSSGRVFEAEVYFDQQLATTGAPAAKVKWHDTGNVETVEFKQTLKGRYLKLVVKSEVRGQPFAAVAELDVIPAE